MAELARRCDLTTLSSDIHDRPLSKNRHCPDANGMAPFDSRFERGLAENLHLAVRPSPALEPGQFAAAPVAHARTSLHAP